MSRLSLAAICLNENHYLLEWLNWHTSIGVDHFYLYDNSDDNNLTVPTEHQNRVTVIHYPGIRKQCEAYSHYDSTYRNTGSRQDWTLVLDVDEFFVLKTYTDIKNYIEHLNTNDIKCVGINWKIFGSNNNQQYIAKPVTERFQQCHTVLDPHIKSLYRDDMVTSSWGCPHHPETDTSIFSTGGTVIDEHLPFSPTNGSIKHDPEMFIAHYFCKSREEWKNKQSRGRADTGEIRNESDFNFMDHNEVHDPTLHQLYQKILVEK